MTEKDTVEKLLEDHNDVFADIVNVLLFDGKKLIQENDLETTKTVSQYKAEEFIRNEDRDVSKFWAKEKVRISLIGMENQTIYDPDMVFHMIGHDGASYRDELNHDDGRYPVVTLVLYFGTDRHWGKNRLSLYDVFQDMPAELKPFVNDYKINVFEIAWLSDEQVAKFQSDFRIVADYFVQMRKNGVYVPSREDMKHVSEVLRFMEAVSHDRAFQNTQNKFRRGDDEQMSMADWFDQKLDEAFERGKAEERKNAEDVLKKAEEERRIAEKERKIAEEERKKAEEALKLAESLRLASANA